MTDAREVYRHHPEEYDALVRCEDRDGNLLGAIRAIAPLEGADVVELREMQRVLRPGGTAIVIETLGTGHAVPFDPPLPLARYYAMLADDCRFARAWIRTDYEFPSPAEGERLVRFFFGDALASRFAAGGGTVLPECTGLWWGRK